MSHDTVRTLLDTRLDSYDPRLHDAIANPTTTDTVTATGPLTVLVGLQPDTDTAAATTQVSAWASQYMDVTAPESCGRRGLRLSCSRGRLLELAGLAVVSRLELDTADVTTGNSVNETRPARLD